MDLRVRLLAMSSNSNASNLVKALRLEAARQRTCWFLEHYWMLRYLMLLYTAVRNTARYMELKSYPSFINMFSVIDPNILKYWNSR